MTFNKEEVFPGTKVKLSLKASPGSVFAISAVDKSVHFLGDANDVGKGQVNAITLNPRLMVPNSIFWWKVERVVIAFMEMFCINSNILVSFYLLMILS